MKLSVPLACSLAMYCACSTSRQLQPQTSREEPPASTLVAAERPATPTPTDTDGAAPPETSGVVDASQLLPLEVAGFLPAVLFTPAGNEPRPLVVTTHGAGGAPEGLCAYWVRLTRGRAFVLSLRGTPLNSDASAFFYRDHLALGRELKAALAAVKAHLGQRIAPGSGIYSGFSQGATMGVGMIVPFGADLPQLVLIEGGYDYWNVAHARAFAQAGGKRVLLACGTHHCDGRARKAAEWMAQAGLEVRVETAAGAGHTPGGEVMARVESALPWVVSGQPAWEIP